jgi:hypothetical protein
MIEKTKECISAGVETICEAAFSYDGLYCAVDILRKQDGGYAIYEVKSSTKEAEIYGVDIAYQKYVLEHCGMTDLLAKLLRPILKRLFPDTRRDAALSRYLSANICANILGLGNAATPMGIQAAQRMAASGKPGIASDQLCRLIVLNTASIQLIPTSVAAVRLAAGCATPFDILPAVWLTSLCSAALGLLSAWGMGKLWCHA